MRYVTFMPRPAKYRTPEEKRQANAERQARHRARRRVELAELRGETTRAPELFTVTVYRSGADLDGLNVCTGLSDEQAAELVRGLRATGRFHMVQQVAELNWGGVPVNL